MNKIIFTPEQKQYIINNYANHKKSTGELAEEFNCHSCTINKRLKEWGFEASRSGHYRFKDLTGQTFGKLTVLKLNQERYDRDLQKTNKPHKYWQCICSCGRLTEVESSHLKSGHTTSCGCIKSKGEQKITEILIQNNISFTNEVYFDDLKGYGNGLLRFDFAILNEKQIQYLIEYNGEQHYKITGGWCTEEEFNIRQFNDNQKINYCIDKNIPLIIIPYTHYSKLTLKDLLIETSDFSL